MKELKLTRNPAAMPYYKPFGYFHQLRIFMYLIQHFFQFIKRWFFVFHFVHIKLHAKLIYKTFGKRGKKMERKKTIKNFADKSCERSELEGLSEHNANQVKAKCGLRGLAFKPHPLCMPAEQAAGFPFGWKESKDGRGLCFSKDLNRLLLIMIITITKGDNNDRRC